MGLQKVAFLPVHVPQGSTLGQRHLPKGGQRYQRGAEEKGRTPETLSMFSIVDPDIICNMLLVLIYLFIFVFT